jgi:hypothetical protein
MAMGQLLGWGVHTVGPIAGKSPKDEYLLNLGNSVYLAILGRFNDLL